MAFDRTNPTHLATLKAMVPDPNINTQLILDDLNSPTLTVGPAPLRSNVLLKMIFQKNISGPNQYNIQLLYTACSGEGLRYDMSEFRSTIIGLGDVGLNALIAANTRFLSKAEVAFSTIDENGTQEFVVITAQDWFAARDS